MRHVPRVLVIGGTDSSGGAGLPTDLRTCMALGCFGVSAVTAVIAQNARRVLGMQVVSSDLLNEQVYAIFEEGPVDAIKIGALCSLSQVQTVRDLLRGCSFVPIVFDPVLVTSSGFTFLGVEEMAELRLLFSEVDVCTPNREEVARIVKKETPTTTNEVEMAAKYLQQSTGSVVVVTGGDTAHNADDCVALNDSVRWLCHKKVDTPHTRGTGCAFATAIACRLACGEGPLQAIQQAKTYVTNCLRSHVSRSAQAPGPVHPVLTTYSGG